MSLSKPSKVLNNVLAAYLEALFNNPIRTKSLSSCVIAVLANLTSQYISGCKKINQDSVLAFGLFGLIFGGSVPHEFYEILDWVFPDTSKHAVLKQLLFERIVYTPLYQFFSLYSLARLEGKTHNQTMSQIYYVYWSVLKANWKWLTVLQFINLTFVPPLLRVLVYNLIGFFWIVFLATKRQEADSKRNRNRLE